VTGDKDGHFGTIGVHDRENGVKPPDCGSLVMKSIATVSKGHALSAGVIGNIGGWVGWVLTLVIWQVADPLMYSVTKNFMLGHQ